MSTVSYVLLVLGCDVIVKGDILPALPASVDTRRVRKLRVEILVGGALLSSILTITWKIEYGSQSHAAQTNALSSPYVNRAGSFRGGPFGGGGFVSSEESSATLRGRAVLGRPEIYLLASAMALGAAMDATPRSAFDKIADPPSNRCANVVYLRHHGD